MMELMKKIDGFEDKKKIKVIMDKNRIEILDKELIRKGRIDSKIELKNKNEEDSLDIIKINYRKMNIKRGIKISKIEEIMKGD
jgi:ATP-dependent 26S proteasome regulatory subunit